MFIDMHCHILPEIDDGAESIFDTVEMVAKAEQTGTNIMIATPHYNYPEKSRKVHCKAELIERYKQFVEYFSNKSCNIRFFLGAELLADDNIDNLCKKNELVTINGSRYILTEFYFDEKLTNVFRYAESLISSGFVPIIAHPERYGFFDKQQDLEHLIKIGCKFQLNKGSLLGDYGKKAKEVALMMLKNDYVHFIASDCHNAASRNADLSELYVQMLGSFSQNKLDKLFHDNQKLVLLDKEF